jgi:hypothetical protein
MSHAELYVTDPAEAIDRLHGVGPVDIVVGIPSFKEADSIAHVVRQADLGLREFFPDHRAVILNVDNDSPDGTEDAFRHAGSRTPTLYLSTPPGVTGKGNNFWNLFVAARHLEAKSIVCVDADLVSISPIWMRRLAEPVLNDLCDYITPIYARNEYDGTITNNICYPLIRGTLGTRIRQPIGGDFGLSTRFSNALLEETWLATTREFGIDIFLTSCALLGDYRVAQTHLGAKVHKPSAPKLGPMFSQVVNTLFSRLSNSRDRWMHDGEAAALPVLGDGHEGNPQTLAVDYKSIKRTTFKQYRRSRECLTRHLSPERIRHVADMMDLGVMELPEDVWCQCVFDLFHAYALNEDDRPEIVEALKPLFFARVASFYKETLELDHHASEERIHQQAEFFHRERTTLVERFAGARQGV